MFGLGGSRKRGRVRDQGLGEVGFRALMALLRIV